MCDRFDLVRRISKSEAFENLPNDGHKRFAEVFRHGSLSVEIYSPTERDLQGPHTRDEVYVVLEGSGYFLCDTQRQPFAPGDVLFAPAGAVHRFEEFGENIVVWVFFYGPEGGERRSGAEGA
jgi:mannose-6-phosphate isomerase-like protein (cupin superfamily)